MAYDKMKKFEIYDKYISKSLEAKLRAVPNIFESTNERDRYIKEQQKLWHPDNITQDTNDTTTKRKIVSQALNDNDSFKAWIDTKIQEIGILQYSGEPWFSCTINYSMQHPKELNFKSNTHRISYYNNDKQEKHTTYFTLRKIVLPKTNLVIEAGTFEDAWQLQLIEFKSNHNKNDESNIILQSNSFSACNSLNDINFPINTYFGRNVFSCSGCGKVFHYRASFSFYDSSAPLARTLGSPTNRTKIVNSIVNHTIVFEDNTISNYVFNNTEFLDTQFKNWDAIRHVENCAFQKATGKLNLPDSPVFYLPPSIETIGDNAFESCSLIPEVLQLPPTLTQIGIHAFSNTELKKIICTPWQHAKFCDCFSQDTTFEETLVPLTYLEHLEFKPGMSIIQINVESVSDSNYILADTDNENIFVKLKAVVPTQNTISLACYNTTENTLKTKLTINIF